MYNRYTLLRAGTTDTQTDNYKRTLVVPCPGSPQTRDIYTQVVMSSFEMLGSPYLSECLMAVKSRGGC